VGLEEEQLSDLKSSRKIVGELLPVVKDQQGRVLNGRHRLAAGWKSSVVMPVRDDLDFLLKRLHFLVQRRASAAEQSEVITSICKELERQGIPTEKIASKVVREISPWESSYTYEVIPDRYKSAVGRPRAEFPVGGNSQRTMLRVQTSDGEPPVRVREDSPAPAERSYPCPNCHTMLRKVSFGLELA
jgi:hypothetical protein